MNRNAGPFGNRGIVGKVGSGLACRLFMGAQDALVVETLRRLRGMEVLAWHGIRDDLPRIRPLERVGDGNGWQNRWLARRKLFGNPIEQCGIGKRRTPSWIITDSMLLARRASGH